MKKVYLDEGHNFGDPGAVGNGLHEADLTRKIVSYAKKHLLEQYEGVTVKTTLESNLNSMTLSKRADMANNWGANLFVSVHINAGKGTGFETFVYPNCSAQSIAFQNVLHGEILRTMQAFGQIADRGKKRANHAVTRLTNMPAVLTENLFIDSNDAKRLKDESFLQSVGEAHARGIASFLGLKPKAIEKMAENDKKYRLRTGTFGDKVTAERMAAELKQKYGWIVYIDEE